MKNWYCRPASEAEAIEIVERAVANGAVAEEVIYNMSIGAYEYHWNIFNYWGVFHGKTIVHMGGRISNAGELLTIQQVREQFPLPHEAKVMSDKKEWKGPQDVKAGYNRNSDEALGNKINVYDKKAWQPKPGDWVEVSDDVSAFYVGKTIEGMHLFQEKSKQDVRIYKVIESLNGLKPLHTEREKWVEYVTGLVKPGAQTDESLAGEIYDAIKSGALKAPEAE